MLAADCYFHFEWVISYYNILLVECTELVVGKSTEATARNNKLKLNEKCHPCSLFQITNMITASREHLIMSWLDRIRVCNSPELRCLQPWQQETSDTDEAQYNDSSSKVRGHSQMTSQHWTNNGNLKSWWNLTSRDHRSSEKMMNDEKSQNLCQLIVNLYRGCSYIMYQSTTNSHF